jgi:hypothetical protein
MEKFEKLCMAIGFIWLMAQGLKIWGWLDSLTDDYLNGVVWLAAQVVLYIAPIAIFYFIYMRLERAAEKKENEEKWDT